MSVAENVDQEILEDKKEDPVEDSFLDKIKILRSTIATQVEKDFSNHIKGIPKQFIEGIAKGKLSFESEKTESLIYLIHSIDNAIDTFSESTDHWNETKESLPDPDRFFETKNMENGVEKNKGFAIRIRTLLKSDFEWYSAGKEGGKLSITTKMHEKPTHWRYIDV